MSFTIQILCKDCDKPMRYDRREFELNGILYWMCWSCELEVMSTDFRACLIDRRVSTEE